MYKVSCLLCNSSENQVYEGEADRPLHYRLQDHKRAAANPSSYPNNAIGQHYASVHPHSQPKLSFKILDVQTNTLKRKLSEANLNLMINPNLKIKKNIQLNTEYLYIRIF